MNQHQNYMNIENQEKTRNKKLSQTIDSNEYVDFRYNPDVSINMAKKPFNIYEKLYNAQT